MTKETIIILMINVYCIYCLYLFMIEIKLCIFKRVSNHYETIKK